MNKFSNRFALVILVFFCFSCGGRQEPKVSFSESFVRIHESNPFYFQLSNGDTYIPIGCNICWYRDSMEEMEGYFRSLGENGGNYARLWLAHGMFEYETAYGHVDEEKLERIDRVLEIADRYGIKVKMCVESFRQIEPEANGVFVKHQYHVANGGPFTSMEDYISERGQRVFIDRLMVFKDRYGDDPRIFAWEIWNEMNAIHVADLDSIIPWNEAVLTKMHEIFPRNLVTQSLGSFDGDWAVSTYEGIMKIEANDMVQVHRYLDEGVLYDVCHGPVDVLTVDAVDMMLDYGLRKPVLLAETGAVKPRHTGPHTAYDNDTEGVILHDVLFAPFFAGAAGPGHNWHWDEYIAKNNVWFQFRCFANAIEGVDPAAEKFEPVRLDQNELRVYGLRGTGTGMVWIRDVNSSWETELRDGIPAGSISGKTVDLSQLVDGKKIKRVEIYDPWSDEWKKAPKNTVVELPDFKRSLVVKVTH